MPLANFLANLTHRFTQRLRRAQRGEAAGMIRGASTPIVRLVAGAAHHAGDLPEAVRAGIVAKVESATAER